jgi:hypothetical protein
MRRRDPLKIFRYARCGPLRSNETAPEIDTVSTDTGLRREHGGTGRRQAAPRQQRTGQRYSQLIPSELIAIWNYYYRLEELTASGTSWLGR